MDAQTLTFSGLGALFMGGLVVMRFLWTIHSAVIKKHEQDDAKITAVEDKFSEKIRDVHARIDRNKDECRKNEKEITDKVTDLRIDLVKKDDLHALEKSIEGNVTSYVDKRVAELEAKIPQMMMDALKTFKPS